MLLYLLILLAASPARALDTIQVTTPDPLLEDWRWTEFDRRSGLLGNINDIFEDRDGNIWFATDKGAQKYDGYRWTNYTTENGLPHEWVTRIRQTRDGAIWICSGTTSSTQEPSASVTRLVETTDSPEELTTHVFEGWAGINGFLEAEDGAVWVNLLGNLEELHDLRRYVNGQWETVDQPARAIFDPVEDESGHIWIGSAGESRPSLIRFDGVRWAEVRLDPGFVEPRIQAHEVSLDASGNIWVRHHNENTGVSRLIDGRWEHFSLARSRSLWHSTDGTVWVGGGGTVSRYRNSQWFTYRAADLPRITSAVGGLEASDGSIWLWNWRGGRAFRVDLKSAVTLYDHSDSLRIGPEGSGRTMWFRTQTSAVRRENDRWIEYGPEDGFLDGHVAKTARATDGTIWAIGFHQDEGSAARFNSGRWEIFTESDGVIDTPKALLPARGGSIWVIGVHEGQGAVSRFVPTSGFERFTSVMSGPEGVETAYEASDGTVWFGSDIDGNRGTGLYRYDPDHTETGNPEWMHFDEKDGLTTATAYGPLDGSARDFIEWPTGTLWIGMAMGLYRIDLAGLPEQRTFWQRTHDAFDILLPKFQNFTPAGDVLWSHPYHPRGAGAIRYDGETWQILRQTDGLPDDGIVGLFRSSDGAVWFRGTTSGLSRYEARKDRPGYGWTRYPADRISGTTASGGTPMISAAAQVTHARDGSFWLNAGTGVAQIRYEEVEAPETFLKPATESVAADGSILLRFSGRTRWDFTPPEDLSYSWRLNEDEWTQTRNALVSLAALEPGPYRFEVRAEAPTLRVDLTPAVHSFVVAAPWWRNPIVAGPGILLIIAVVFQSVRVVRSKQQLQQSVDALSAANHELFAVNVALQRDRSVERIRGQVQSMDRAEDFEKVLSLLTSDLNEVGLTFESCEIDVLDEPVQNPTMAFFETNGFHYTTYRLNAEGHVTSRSYRLAAPFPTVNEQTLERFIDGEPWQGTSEGLAIVEVPAGGYGRLRLTAPDRNSFTDDEVAALREFAGAVASATPATSTSARSRLRPNESPPSSPRCPTSSAPR